MFSIETIKESSRYEEYVKNNDGFDDPHLAELLYEIQDYLLWFPTDGKSCLTINVIYGGEEKEIKVEKQVKTFDTFLDLLEFIKNHSSENYFVLYSLNRTTITYYSVDGKYQLLKSRYDESNATMKMVHRNNVISQL